MQRQSTPRSTNPLNETMGYVSVQLVESDARLIHEQLVLLGIDNGIAPKDLHSSLFSPKEPVSDGIASQKETVHVALMKPTPIMLGTAETGYALAFELECQTLVDRHAEIRKASTTDHTFANFLPHMSVKYAPDDGDLEKLRQAFVGMALRFTNETRTTS